jgi:uncharacterized protein (TIGR03083 family)
MSGLLDIWRQAAAKWSGVYGQVTESQWERPTPCEEWTVRQLVDHTLSWQAEGGRLIGADTAPGDDWDRIRAAFDALLSDPSQLTGNVAEFGGIPKQELAGFLIGDLLIHSWDLSRSIGADEALPPGRRRGHDDRPPPRPTRSAPRHQPARPEDDGRGRRGARRRQPAGQDAGVHWSPTLGTDPGRSHAAASTSDRRDRPGSSSVNRSPPGVPGGRCGRGS